MTNLKLHGFDVLAHNSDAGGSNSGVKRILLKTNKNNDSNAWMDSNEVTFKNPCDIDSRVAILLCSTHNKKLTETLY